MNSDSPKYFYLFKFIYCQLKDNCFTIFCWSLPYINMISPNLYGDFVILSISHNDVCEVRVQGSSQGCHQHRTSFFFFSEPLIPHIDGVRKEKLCSDLPQILLNLCGDENFVSPRGSILSKSKSKENNSHFPLILLGCSTLDTKSTGVSIY